MAKWIGTRREGVTVWASPGRGWECFDMTTDAVIGRTFKTKRDALAYAVDREGWGLPESRWTETATCPRCGWTGPMVHYLDHAGTWAVCGNPDPVDGDAGDDGAPVPVFCLNGDRAGWSPWVGFEVIVKHPDYPPVRANDPAMDRCICGGVRYWHGAAMGCDDCRCRVFRTKGRGE